MVTPRVTATGRVRGVFFSLGTTPTTDPNFNCAQALIDLFDGAKKSAHVAIYTLTDPAIVAAMIAATQRGVEVSIVTDASESNPKLNPTQAKLLQKLIQAGVVVHVAMQQKALMHNKVGIFDGRTVSTGSFNWTSRAEHFNDENLVVIDGKSVAADYEQYVFQRILQHETTMKLVLSNSVAA